MVVIPCCSCGSPVELQVDQPKIINLRYSSMIVIEHGKASTCLSCGVAQLAIVGAVEGLRLASAPSPAETSGLIAIPGGMLPQ